MTAQPRFRPRRRGPRLLPAAIAAVLFIGVAAGAIALTDAAGLTHSSHLSRAPELALALLPDSQPTAAYPADAPSLPPLTAPIGGWTESASREFYDSSLQLKWRHMLGDWRDTAGDPQGLRPFATASVPAGGRTATLDVTTFVQLYGADFFIRPSNGESTVASREGADGPSLEVVKRGETRTLTATADVALDPSTFRSQGEQPAMRTSGPMLIRFAQGAHPSVTRATLTLTLAGGARAPVEFALFRPDAGGDVAMPAFRRAGPGDTIARWTGRDLARHPDWRANSGHARVDGDIVTAWIPRDDLSALSLIEPVHGGEAAFATVVMRFAPDWSPPIGGKMPGLANTGQGRPAVDGLGASGWGGRQANGLRWSARTGYTGTDAKSATARGQVALSSYFYAVKPPGIWGTIVPWSRPAPKGRWFAYTQYVKLNAAGTEDGALGYWLDGTPVMYRDGIAWRSRGGRESEINEFWFDVYCGGTNCGPAPRSHDNALQIASVTITRAPPDFSDVQREVDRLNARR